MNLKDIRQGIEVTVDLGRLVYLSFGISKSFGSKWLTSILYYTAA